MKFSLTLRQELYHFPQNFTNSVQIIGIEVNTK